MAPQENEGAPSLKKMSERRLLDDLAASITSENRQATFACGGSIAIDVNAEEDKNEESKPVHVRFGPDGEGTTLTLPAGDDIEKLEKLLAACAPASFGRGGEAVLDDNYRKAGKLDTDQFLTSFCPYATGIIDVVTQLLLPNSTGGEPRAIKAELYKLNVYSAPGGKFKPHVDTPRSTSQIGSLVVALPVTHEGGELAVRFAGKEMVFDWSSNAEDEETVISWAAFYSDCEHEVFEVTSGHRVTLTYNLYAVSPAPGLCAGNAKGVLDPVQLPLYQSLQPALENPGFLPQGEWLGIFLTHNYAHTSGQAKFLPKSLKGSDMAFFEAARALGLTCLLRPRLSGPEYETEDEDGYEYETTLSLMGNKFRSIVLGHEVDEHDKVGDVERMYPSQRLDDNNVTWLNSWDSKLEEPALAYIVQGNQPELEVHYSAAVLLLHIPPLMERNSSSPAPSSLSEGMAVDGAE